MGLPVGLDVIGDVEGLLGAAVGFMVGFGVGLSDGFGVGDSEGLGVGSAVKYDGASRMQISVFQDDFLQQSK